MELYLWVRLRTHNHHSAQDEAVIQSSPSPTGAVAALPEASSRRERVKVSSPEFEPRASHFLGRHFTTQTMPSDLFLF
jgi:hypothetical protein